MDLRMPLSPVLLFRIGTYSGAYPREHAPIVRDPKLCCGIIYPVVPYVAELYGKPNPDWLVDVLQKSAR